LRCGYETIEAVRIMSSNVNWKGVAASAGATLAVVGIAIAYGLGQQSASPPPLVVTQAAPSPALPPAVPAPTPAIAAPPPLQPAVRSPEALLDEMHASAVRIAGLQGEELVGALWRMEGTVTDRVTYAQLERNAERYTSTPAIYSGEVLEIHDQDEGAFLRIAVDDNYDHAMAVIAIVPPADSVVRGRRVRVYGVLAGSFSYTSQANYELTIPRIIGIAVVPASTPRRAPRQ
jgi:hypothetical protein